MYSLFTVIHQMNTISYSYLKMYFYKPLKIHIAYSKIDKHAWQ